VSAQLSKLPTVIADRAQELRNSEQKAAMAE
jgi:hypothetical protein